MLPLKVNMPWLSTAKVNTLTFLGHLKALWNIWDLRTLILLSLGLQITLILIAPFRKKTGNGLVIFTIWASYLLADYIAILAIGLIPNYSVRTTTSAYATHSDLLAFWAPFLLVHLGGPDTITALALEDNELWMRTVLHLFTYMSATGRVFFQSLPANILALPTILMLFAGFFKYLERASSFYFARLTQFKSSMLTDPDPGPNYAKIMESYDSYLNSSLPTRFDTNPSPTAGYNYDTNEIRIDIESEGEEARVMSRVKLVRDAFEFFNKYKGLYVDLTYSIYDRKKSRAYFLHRSLTPEDAFTVLAIELNFTYEVFFTKMIVVHQKFGVTIRYTSFVLEVVSLLIWILFIDQQQFHKFDIWITYTLLAGSVITDSIAFLRLVLSDWQLVMLNKESEIRASLYNKLLSARCRTWGSYWGQNESPLRPWLRRMFFRRWSESVFQFSLLNYCVNPWSSKWTNKLLFKILPPLKDKCEGIKYVSRKWFANNFRNFIFYEIKHKAIYAEQANYTEEICESRGMWVLRSLARLNVKPFLFSRWTKHVEYDESLLTWHIATEILYQVEDDCTCTSTIEKEYRKYCKTLSDYMMYLLNRQPGMMIAVSEATIFFADALKTEKGETKEQKLMTACWELLKVNTTTPPTEVKGTRSKSVLFDAVQLAKRLREVNKIQYRREYEYETVGMWELMAKVWVELMCYAASHTRASAHAGQLKQGGELLTLVWLLMVHLGLGKQFRTNQTNNVSALITSK